LVYGVGMRGSSYLLFRPKAPGERNIWRRNFMDESRKEVEVGGRTVSVFGSIDIPAFLYPVRANAVPFNSFGQANKTINLHWSSISSRRFNRDLADFREHLEDVFTADRRMARYGIFGLYTNDATNASPEGKPRLQSVFTLLPGQAEPGATVIPVIVSSLKAPWNMVDGRKKLTYENWKGQHWGIDLAALIFAIRTYFKKMPASFPEEVIAAWRFRLALPSSQPARELSGAKKRGNGLSDLAVDLRMFGFEIDDIDLEPAQVFRKEIIYNMQLDAEQAQDITSEYRNWMSRIFEPEKKGN